MSETILCREVLHAKFGTLVDDLQEAFLIENERGEIILVNQKYCDLFHLRIPPERLLGMNCSTAEETQKGLYKDPEGYVARTMQLRRDREPASSDQLEVVNGIVLERDYLPVFWEYRYVGSLWKYRDITKHYRLSQGLKLALLMQQEKSSELEQFANVLLHDIKAPVRGIGTLTKWIRDEMERSDEVNALRHLDLLDGCVSDMQQMIHALDEHVRIGTKLIPVTKCNVTRMVAEVCDAIGHEFLPLIEVRDQLAEIELQRPMMLKAFSILICNSFKYNHRDEKCLLISASETDRHNIIRFKDNGSGFDLKSRSRLVAGFQKGARTGANSPSFGLTTVKKIVSAHNGVIQVESEVGEGTTITMALPKQTHPGL